MRNPSSRDFDRRDFLKTMAAVGAAAVAGVRPSVAGDGETHAPAPAAKPVEGKVPTRPFGKTGVNVSILALGGMFDIPNNQLIMRQALEWGVTYWDTADCYEGGKSEAGIGKFLAANKGARDQVFLVSKSDARDPDGIASLLDRSLSRMKTDRIDLYFLHGIKDANELTDDVKAWAHRAKKDGKIRFFGFSAHSNMERNLLAASKLDWIDGIMFSYNYRLMHKPGMVEAVDACAKAGIGLTAMKTQGGGQVKTHEASEARLAAEFLGKGFTEAQAKIKAVWGNEKISAVCSQMPNMSVLMSNVAAALDQTKLAAADLELLQQVADDTCAGYCAGCGRICSAALGGDMPVSDAMRCLMYYHHYGDRDLARREFASLPPAFRARLATLDYGAAENACPHRMPIARLMREARELLA